MRDTTLSTGMASFSSQVYCEPVVSFQLIAAFQALCRRRFFTDPTRGPYVI
jgi:hypothetical protein